MNIIILFIILIFIIIIHIKKYPNNYTTNNKKSNNELFVNNSRINNNLTQNKSINHILKDNNNFIYIYNRGNAGDSLIAYGTLLLFNKLNLKFTIGPPDKIYKNKTLIFAGGGNLIKEYSNYELSAAKFIQNNIKNNKIIILPHTIYNIDPILNSIQNYKDNIIFFARERKSFLYVKNKQFKVYLEHDMAFNITNNILLPYKKIKPKYNIGNFFRQDVEKTDIKIPDDNEDISNTLNEYNNVNDPKIIKKVAHKIFKKLSNYTIINTNRLHIAVAASLLNKKVNFYKNSYFKNQEVFKFSIRPKYYNTKFLN